MESLPTQPPKPQKHKSKSQVIFIIGLLIILILVISLDILSFMGKINLKDKYESQTIPSLDNANKKEANRDTSSWKIYEGNFFSFKYPIAWEYKDCSKLYSNENYTSEAVCFLSEDYREDIGFAGSPNALIHPNRGSVLVASIYNNIIPDEERRDFAKDPCRLETNRIPKPLCEVIEIDGNPAAKVTEEASGTGIYGPASLMVIEVGFIRDNDSYAIGFYYPDCEYDDLTGDEDCNNKIENPKLFNDVIETFKILG